MRNLLHISKLDAFKEWLDDEGTAWRDGRGDYQVIQIYLPTGQWACVYSRHDMPEHYTTDRRLDSFVKQFIRDMKEKKNGS